MTSNILRHRKEIILLAIDPDTIIIPIHHALLEERRHIVLIRRIPLIILADTPGKLRAICTALASLEQICASACVVLASDLALHGQRVAVYEGDVAVAFSLFGEKAFELCVAADWSVFSADEHCTACAVVRVEAYFLGARPETPGTSTGPNAVGVVAPVGIGGGEGDTFLRNCGFRFYFIAWGFGLSYGGTVA